MIFVETGDVLAIRHATRVIEEGQWHDLGKGWKARSDKPHVDGQQPHTHVYFKNNEVLVINQNGTPSHGADLSAMPVKIRQGLRTRKLIESASARLSTPVVPAAIITAAMDAWDLANIQYTPSRGS